MRSTTRRVFALIITGALVLAACGDDDDTATDDIEAPDNGDANGDAEVIMVTAVDYAFQDLPDTVSVGTRLDLRNDSEAELHELVAVRILDDEERSVEELLQLPEDEVEASLVPGPPAMVLLAPPGAQSAIPAVGDGTLTEPGRYAVVCFIPTGADPDEFMAAAEAAGPDAEGPPEVDGGPPHIVHGMFAELIVE